MRTTTIDLPDHGCRVGDTVWLFPTRYGDVPRGMYRVVVVSAGSFVVKRSRLGDLWNRINYA